MRQLVALVLAIMGMTFIYQLYPSPDTCGLTRYYITYVYEIYPNQCGRTNECYANIDKYLKPALDQLAKLQPCKEGHRF